MNKNSGIQGLRAIAAFLVVLQHGIFFACTAKGVDFTPYLPIGFGQMGVGVFFVISGYVMTLCLKQGAMFMPQRIARIYPAFWAAVALSGVVLPFLGRVWHLDGYSLTLLPAAAFNESYAVPYWTLVYEMLFYAIMYAFIVSHLSHRTIAFALGAWAALIIVSCQFGVHEFPSDVAAMLAGKWILVSPANLEFIAGALYGLVGADALRGANPLSLAIQALILFLIAQIVGPMPYYVRYALWGISFALVLHLARDVRFGRVLERAGDYSYGLYLVHTVLIAVAMYLMVRFWAGAPLVAYLVAAIATALVGGLAFGRVEFWFHSTVIKGALKRSKKHVTTDSVSAN
jgi:peptidoglycan/LPS O-acetylase OafA/YrhL